MPEQTFFNLPPEKRGKIVEAAIDEFACHSIKTASIARIVEAAGIPRGSFYQYFTGLKDLYRYIISVIADKKMEKLTGLLAEFDKLDTFAKLRELYRAGLEFAAENPRMALIGSHFMKESEELRSEIIGEYGEKGQEFFRGILMQGLARGEIDGAVDIDFISFLMFTMNTALADYYLARLDKDGFMPDLDQWLSLVDKMLYVVENGIRKREGK